MKVTEHIEKAKGKTLFSFEIVPPKKGNNIEELYKNIEPLLEFKPHAKSTSIRSTQMGYWRRNLFVCVQVRWVSARLYNTNII